MRVLPESLMILLASAIVTGQCLQPGESRAPLQADAAIDQQQPDLAISPPTLSVAMTRLAPFDEPLCPGRLPEDVSGIESLAGKSPVAIQRPEASDII